MQPTRDLPSGTSQPLRTRNVTTLLVLLCCTGLLTWAPATAAAPMKCARNQVPPECLQQQFSGAVVVVRRGETMLRAAYGMADETTQQANSLQHRFRIGSVTKTFTGAVAHLQSQRGQIDLDRPLSTYLEGFSSDHGVTGRSLLEHQSGIGDFSQAQWKTLLLGSSTAATSMQLAHAVKRSKPGKQRYSNAGYVLLGEVIQVASQQRLDAVIRTQLLLPLGLSNTGFASFDADISNLSLGHDVRGQLDQQPYQYDALLAIGGMYSTVDDLVTWLRALTDNNNMPTAFVQEPLGWARGVRFGRRAMWHDGLTNTHAAFVLRFRDEDSLIVALSNRGGSGSQLGPLVKSLAAYYFPEPKE
jgi:D-alanyl-D-alanine carboxypeptidase